MSQPSTTSDAIRAETVTKAYGTGPGAVHALRGISVTIPAATFTAVMGPSGSGKSTFLHCAAGFPARVLIPEGATGYLAAATR